MWDPAIPQAHMEPFKQLMLRVCKHYPNKITHGKWLNATCYKMEFICGGPEGW